MSAPIDTTSAVHVDAAIVRVLQAEQAARAAVDQYVAEAEQIRESARLRARAIAERGAERVARVHRWTDAAIRERVEALARERAALKAPEAPDATEPERIAGALERLAAELTGGTP